MKINVTKEDIGANKDPISQAVLRQYGLEVYTDRKYIVFKENERFPRRLSLAAEDFNYRLAAGEKVEPFEFEL